MPFDVNVLGADILIGGCGIPKIFNDKILKSLGRDPIIFALSHPYPEVMPNEAKKRRPDCLIATCRTDFPNMINSVICLPFILRALLDTGTKTVTDDMKFAAAK